MTKIVVNRCYGGFGLSEQAVYRYAELIGKQVWPEKTNYSFTIYWTVPPEEWKSDPDNWFDMPLKERRAHNQYCHDNQITDRDIERDDPNLVKMVEELGERANGDFAKLEVVEISDDIEWAIEEYDGNEWVAEKHMTW